jgi:hypothetical protein
MAEAITIDDQELAIICDLMAGWGAKWDGKLDGNKRQALDQVIAKGFVEPSEEGSLTRYRHSQSLTASGRTLRRNKRRLNCDCAPIKPSTLRDANRLKLLDVVAIAP